MIGYVRIEDLKLKVGTLYTYKNGLLCFINLADVLHYNDSIAVIKSYDTFSITDYTFMSENIYVQRIITDLSLIERMSKLNTDLPHIERMNIN